MKFYVGFFIFSPSADSRVTTTTTSSTSCTNSFPQRKRHHMRYALVPIAGSSPGLTINFAAISLFACFIDRKFSFSLTSMIVSHLCQPYYCYLICILNCQFLWFFLCYSFASVKCSIKNLLTYLPPKKFNYRNITI